MSKLIPVERIENKIFIIKGQKVMLDRDLAELYGVQTKGLNQAVKRNRTRFPKDFMFQLTEKEKKQLVTNCDRFKLLKHSSALPYAFTEQGVAMLSSVLKSERAIQVNIVIMRVFVRLKQILSTHKKLAQKLQELEVKYKKHDIKFQVVFEAIRKLMIPENKSMRKIGFRPGKGN